MKPRVPRSYWCVAGLTFNSKKPHATRMEGHYHASRGGEEELLEMCVMHCNTIQARSEGGCSETWARGILGLYTPGAKRRRRVAAAIGGHHLDGA
eukprot:1743080-Prymnesium_polylepis.1